MTTLDESPYRNREVLVTENGEVPKLKSAKEASYFPDCLARATTKLHISAYGSSLSVLGVCLTTRALLGFVVRHLTFYPLITDGKVLASRSPLQLRTGRGTGASHKQCIALIFQRELQTPVMKTFSFMWRFLISIIVTIESSAIATEGAHQHAAQAETSILSPTTVYPGFPVSLHGLGTDKIYVLFESVLRPYTSVVLVQVIPVLCRAGVGTPAPALHRRFTDVAGIKCRSACCGSAVVCMS